MQEANIRLQFLLWEDSLMQESRPFPKRMTQDLKETGKVRWGGDNQGLYEFILTLRKSLYFKPRFSFEWSYRYNSETRSIMLKDGSPYIQLVRLSSICLHVFVWSHLHLHELASLQPEYKSRRVRDKSSSSWRIQESMETKLLATEYMMWYASY